MKIYSVCNSTYLSLERVEDDSGYSAYSISVSVDIKHSKFSALNSDIHLLNLSDFISELEEFVLDRSIKPTLLGSYDSFIKIRGGITTVVLDFSIASAYCGNETFMYSTNGSFEISQESINLIINDLRGYA